MSHITNDIEQVMTCLRQNGIAAIPTETVYGLAGNAESDEALSKIYALKKRPTNHPLIMHVGIGWDILQWVQSIPWYAEKLMERFWPGPLTLVLPSRQGRSSPQMTGHQDTIAIRCPDHVLTQRLLEQLVFPLAAPSANLFGKVSPTTAMHVQANFKTSDLLILDGGRCSFGIESTIVDATNPDRYRILRHGVIDEGMLRSFLPNLEFDANTPLEKSNIRVSGGHKSHYQPEKPFFYAQDAKTILQFCEKYEKCLCKVGSEDVSYPIEKKIVIWSFKKEEMFADYPGYQLPLDAQRLAYEFYYQLCFADSLFVDMIVMELPPDTPIWQGIRERALKAGKPIESAQKLLQAI